MSLTVAGKVHSGSRSVAQILCPLSLLPFSMKSSGPLWVSLAGRSRGSAWSPLGQSGSFLAPKPASGSRPTPAVKVNWPPWLPPWLAALPSGPAGSSGLPGQLLGPLGSSQSSSSGSPLSTGWYLPAAELELHLRLLTADEGRTASSCKTAPQFCVCLVRNSRFWFCSGPFRSLWQSC